MRVRVAFISFLWLLVLACNTENKSDQPDQEGATTDPPIKIPVIFDTDANNELDDQHALAYLLLNEEIFDIRAITVNATKSGGEIDAHYAEAKRVLQLCNRADKYPLLKGANADFESIRSALDNNDFDGYEAVDFIIAEAEKSRDQKLVLIPVGKLTNIALALAKAPEIIDKIRVVWLGSNYPKPGEYNQDNDIPSMNYVLSTKVPFEMVTVRYGEPSGTSAVTVSQAFVNEKMPGLGPKAQQPITGRHGGTYENFGDYAVSLFEHIDYHDSEKTRALFDLAAVAIIKNPGWAKSRTHPCPVFTNGQWQEQPDNTREIVIWEYFDKDGIVDDFMQSLRNH